MITEANANLSESHCPFKKGIYKETVYRSAHIMCWLVIQFFKSQFFQGLIEVWIFTVDVTVDVSTDNGWIVLAHHLNQSILKSLVVSAPIDVDDINILT